MSIGGITLCPTCGNWRYDGGRKCGHCHLEKVTAHRDRLLEDITIMERQWSEEVAALGELLSGAKR